MKTRESQNSEMWVFTSVKSPQCFWLSGRPDMTFAVDWAFNNNYLIYLSFDFPDAIWKSIPEFWASLWRMWFQTVHRDYCWFSTLSVNHHSGAPALPSNIHGIGTFFYGKFKASPNWNLKVTDKGRLKTKVVLQSPKECYPPHECRQVMCSWLCCLFVAYY